MRRAIPGVAIVIAACGGGESKKAPDAGRPPDARKACVVDLAGAVTADQTIAKGCKANVNADVTVDGGTLTIEAGVPVAFKDGASLTVGGGGAAKLVVAGTVAEPVTFGSAGGKAPGAWGQVKLLEGAAGSTITGLVLEHAGQDGAAALLIGAAEVTITESIVRQVGGVGIELAPEAKLAGFTKNKIEKTAREVVRGSPEGLGSLGEENAFDAEQVIAVVPGTLTRSVTWRDHGAPYLVTDEVNIENKGARSTLTLDAGVEVRFGLKAKMRVGKKETGGLKVAGTASAPVVLTSETGKPGAWSLVVGAKGEAVVDGAEISFGGFDHDSGALALEGGLLEVYRTTFHDDVVAVSVDAAGRLHALDGCTFESNSQFAIALHTQLGALGTNTYDDASTIELRGGKLTEDATWKPQAAIWWSGKVVVDTGTLTIEAGSKFTMTEATSMLHVASRSPSQAKKKGAKKTKAALMVKGTAEKPVELAGVRDTPGTWANIVLSGEQESTIEHLVLSGTGGAAGIVAKDFARVTLEGVTCAQCAGGVVTHSCDAQVTLDSVKAEAGTPIDLVAPTCTP